MADLKQSNKLRETGSAFDRILPDWHEDRCEQQYVPSARCLALLEHLPDRTQQTLGQDGIRDLDVALARMASDGAHTLDFRSSIPFIRGRYYLRILWGREKRSLSRLIAEGQTRLHRQALVYAALSWLLVTSSAALALVALYVLKSALGIDLMDGHFFLHDLLLAKA
jgi:hypothetical protein